MSFLINPYVYSTTAAAVSSMLVYALTYDESDQNNANTLTRTGPGPYVTPNGFEGDGYSSRYLLTSGLPATVAAAGGRATLQATAILTGRYNSSRQVLAYLGENTSAANPKLELAITGNASPAAIVLRGYTNAVQTLTLNRSNWKYQFRFPLLTAGGASARPQGILFLDADTVLVSCSFTPEYASYVYKVRLSDGAVLGSFTFGTATFRHVASWARSAAGNVWCVDYETGHTLKIDLNASFNSGAAVILADWNTSAITGVSGIEFVTVGGTEYVLIAQYGSSPVYIYVIPASLMGNGSIFNLADRYKRFAIAADMQGIALSGTDLYLADSSASSAGAIKRYAITTAIASTADGATLSSTLTLYAASFQPEDLAFHPTTGELWTQTEGYASSGDQTGFLSAWSASVSGAAMENTYTCEYDGAGTVTVKINGRAFQTVAWTLTAPGSCLAIGGLPQAAAGYTTGFAQAYVRNVVVSDAAIGATDYANIIGGMYEPNSLTVYTATITNPGAESTTTGWTAESGGLGTRSASPSPKSGAAYFTGGANLATVARQRLSLATITGLSTAQLDALTAGGSLWGRLAWWQANFDATADPGGMGLRYLDATPTQLTQSYSALIFNLPGASTWYQRILPVTAANGARNVDLLQRMDRTAGTNNDTYIDDITLVLYRK